MRRYVGMVIFLVFSIFFLASCEKDDNDVPETVNQAPAFPSNPVPADRAVDVDNLLTLRWDCSDPDSDTLFYTVLFDTVNPPQTQVSLAQLQKTLPREALRLNTVYYWQVLATDSINDSVSGPVWQFTTFMPIEQTFSLGTSGATIDMIWIRPGSYWMGDSSAVALCIPYHEVTINYGFWIGKYEVTQTQWISLMNYNPSHFIGENLPVERVCWDSVHVFLDTLNRQSGDTLWRLPSEAEWEYACRAGTTTRFYWGDDPDYSLIEQYEWTAEFNNGSTHPVGLKQPNPWGLFDMSGNVFELCEDGWHDNYIGAPTNGSAWLAPDRPASKLMRSGSFESYSLNCYSAARWYFYYRGQYNAVGFRLVRNSD